MTRPDKLQRLLAEIRRCRHCAADLPLGPRPVVRARAGARLLIVGQAPGTRVHESGIPWNDRSGDRLRDWTGLDNTDFYDDRLVAIVPMGFCYPGVDSRGGDRPPRPECAPLWHDHILALLPTIELTLLIGSHAQKRYLGPGRGATMTDTVAAWRDWLPRYFVLPHPSWRNTAWLRRHPWFEDDLVAELRRRVTQLMATHRQMSTQASAANA